MTLLLTLFAILLHFLGVLNSMRLWPLAGVEIDDNDDEYLFLMPERTMRQNIIDIWFWEIGTIIDYVSLVRYNLRSGDK